MLKKVWFMFVLWSVLMVTGCSGDIPKDNTDSIAVTANVVAVDNSATSVGTEQTETSETEEQSGNGSNVEVSNTEELTADTTTTEADAEPSTTEVPSEPEAVTTQPTTPPVEPQPTTPEQTTPSTEAPVTEAEALPATDDRGNPADGSPVFEITFNIPQAEYVGYDADRVARLAVEKCKVAGMITLPENLDRLLEEGKITQEEYNEYYPYDGCGYYSVFVETNLNLASTISGERLCSEEAIADYIAGMMVLEVEPSVSYDEAEFCESELAYGAEVLHESELVETELVEVTCELVNDSTEIVDEEYADSQIYYVPDMTKERYEILTDKEKVEWLGIAECSVQDAIQRFITKIGKTAFLRLP